MNRHQAAWHHKMQIRADNIAWPRAQRCRLPKVKIQRITRQIMDSWGYRQVGAVWVQGHHDLCRQETPILWCSNGRADTPIFVLERRHVPWGSPIIAMLVDG